MYWTRLILGNIAIISLTLLWFWAAGKLLDMVNESIDSINNELSEKLKQLKQID